MIKKLLVCLSLVLFASCAMMGVAGEKPTVLIIGDSISLGYTPHVQEILVGKADVRHNKEPDGEGPSNAGCTGRGLERIEGWIGGDTWDIIHFNWGLWDICYRNERGKRDLNGKLSVQMPEYVRRLDKLVATMKKIAPDATLVWAPTTYVQGGWGRIKGDEVKYNAAAAEVMKKHGVRINDIHALTAKFPPELFKSKGNVHFSTEGYRKIAEQVAETIMDVAAERAKANR